MLEIERRFIVDYSAIQHTLNSTEYTTIEQGYLVWNTNRNIRVRKLITSNSTTAVLTIKIPVSKGISEEFEYSIPVADAEVLLSRLDDTKILKQRYTVEYENLPFTVDVFLGNAHPMVIAEIELDNIYQPIKIPPFAAVEVTGVYELSNAMIATHPKNAIEVYNKFLADIRKVE